VQAYANIKYVLGAKRSRVERELRRIERKENMNKARCILRDAMRCDGW